MVLLRRVATGVVIVAALAVLVLSVYLLWNARQWDYLPLPSTHVSDLDARAQMFEDKLEIYNRRVNDMEMLVMILLGISGLYAIIFLLTADFNARSMSRQVDRAMGSVRDQIGSSIGELRDLKQTTRDALRAEVEEAMKKLERLQRETRMMMQEMRADIQALNPSSEHVEETLGAMERRISTLDGSKESEEQRHEIRHYENALPTLEVLHSKRYGSALAQLYRTLGRYYRHRDIARARFYLSRAMTLTPEDFQTLNDLGMLSLEGQKPSDLKEARRHFETSLLAQPNQQRARYGLALVARSQGDLEAAQAFLEEALRSDRWESAPDEANTAMVRYTLSCVLARRAQREPMRRAQYFLAATQGLQAAFEHASLQLDQMLARDTEEGGDLFVLANTPPYENLVDDLLLNVSVGAA